MKILRQLIFMCFLLLLLSGCATMSVKTPDCEVKYSSIYKDFQSVKGDICGGSVDVAESKISTEALLRLFELAE